MMNEARRAEKILRVLHLEDDPHDAELIENELREHGIACSITRIYTRNDFESALKSGPCDLILSDSKLPGFDTVRALTLARQQCPEVPFIFVSGAVSPTARVEALRQGASDFISKDDLPRLTLLVHWLFSSTKHKHRIPALPEVGMPVMVQARDYRCLGYIDREGVWRDFKKSVELIDVIDWSEL
jgi:CheY-like chemotaxis protein